MRLPALTAILAVVLVSTAHAEVRTITATGEYRMGDNDTKTDAKRLALQDGKRLALEKAGTYFESISEVKNFQLSRDELRAYTAGIVEVLEQKTRSAMEGETTVVRVDVTCKIDSAVVTRQIDALRKNEAAKTDLLRSQQEAGKLRQENEALRQKLAAATSKSDIASIQEKRRAVLTGLDVSSLLAQAWTKLVGSQGGTDMIAGSSSAMGRAHARNLIEQALVLEPSNPEAHRTMGILLDEEGDMDGAIAEHNTALRLEPDHPDNHVNLGTALYRKGDLDGAIAEYRAALSLKPDFALARNSLGSALAMNGDLDGAITEFRAALRLQPDLASAHYNLGLALYKKGDLDGAIAAYRTALRLKADYAKAYYDLGNALYGKGDLDDAITAYRAALRLKPDYAVAHYNLGNAFKAKGQRKEAAGAFRKYLRLTPDTPDNRQWIEQARQALRDLE